MKWHRKRQLITSLFAAGIVLLAAMAGVSLYLDARMVQENAALSAIRDRVTAATDLLVALIDIETGVRGYLIAADPTYLEPYYRGRDTVTQIESTVGPDLGKWTAPGHPDQPLGPLMKQRSALMEAAIETARTRGTATAQDQLRNSDAKTLMDAMRAVIAQQLNGYADQSNALQHHADALASLHSLFVVLSLTLAILFSIGQFVLFRGEVNGRGEIELVLRRRNDERRQITELSAALQLSDSRHESYKVIEAYARRILPEVSGAFYVYTASRDQLTLVAQWSAVRPIAQDDRERCTGFGFADHLHPADCWGLRQGGRHTGSTEIGAAIDSDAAPLNCRHIESGAGPYTCIPIIGRGQILGMLHLRGEVFRSSRTSEHISPSIERLADQLSLSLTNLDLREKLENMALRDGLTGLYNRRFLDEMLEHELAKLRRNGKRAGLMLLDVDHFKRFNDTYGHQAGDEALRKVGAALLATVRASDVVCRYGGEEFLVFLPECDRAEAASKAEALRAAVSAIKLQVGGEAIPSISASFGLAIFPDVAGSRTDLIQLADRALYRAKGEGRNRVVIAESPAPATAQAAK